MQPPSDQASLEREAREAEMRARDKFCPECGAQVWPVDGINVGVDRYHQVTHVSSYNNDNYRFISDLCGLQ